MTELVIIGGSTAFYEIAGIIADINSVKPMYKVVGVLDDDPSLKDKELAGVPVLGTISKAAELHGNARFIFGIGSLRTRLIRHEILAKTGLQPEHFESIIHPHTSIDSNALMGPGCIIHHGVAIGNHAELKGFNIVAVNSALGPNSVINEHAMITSLCLVLTGAKIGRNSFVGAGSIVTEGVSVEKGCFVGVGSIVTRDLAEGTFGMGNPFRVLKIENVSGV